VAGQAALEGGVGWAGSRHQEAQGFRVSAEAAPEGDGGEVGARAGRRGRRARALVRPSWP